MGNWKSIKCESNVKTALIILCQDYVMFDEDFSNNAKIKKNKNNASFWIDLADTLLGSINVYLQEKNGIDNEGYDDEYEISDDVIIDFIMNVDNRFELNDIICETMEKWLRHFSGKNFH